MAEPKVILDPDGDLLVILRNPSPGDYDKPQSSELEGELGVPMAYSSAVRAAMDAIWGGEEDVPSTHSTLLDMPTPLAWLLEVKFLVSSKHLSLASIHARLMLSGPWLEATQVHDDGLRHWVIEGFDANAMSIVLSIMHNRHDNVPKTVQLEMLVEIARIVDYVGCYDAMVLYAKTLWIPSLKPPILDLSGTEIMLWICVAGVFREEEIFKECTRLAILGCDNDIPTLGLPILPEISEEINRCRERSIDELFTLIDDLVDRLTKGETRCSLECDSMYLGMITKQLHDKWLNPRPTSPYWGLSVNSVVSTIRGFPHTTQLREVVAVEHNCKTDLSLIKTGCLVLRIEGLDIKCLKID
ncbi:hypothetical protein F4680DRAFT_450910 [Xylaria scruposa]|nr:hypothetical protein F4680DRAFT_450910 [Xylaria scruposa]